MLEQQIQQIWPTELWRDTRLMVAISGGADSVALLIALARIAGSTEWIVAAHFNHCWRGEESDADQVFVTELCERLGIELHVARADETANEPLARNEESARDARYAFLTRVAYETGTRYVATGHTASDRIETLLHNLFRGTGLAGVSTPTPTRALHDELVLVRPLLGTSRTDVTDYLKHLGQDYREDSSNENLDYRRNFIRKQLLPLLREQYGEHVDGKLLSFSEIAQETQAMILLLASEYVASAEEQVEQAYSSGILAKLSGASFVFPTRGRLEAAWPVVQQAVNMAWLERNWALQSMNRSHWDSIRKIWQTPALNTEFASSTNLPGNISMKCYRGFVTLNQH